MRCQSQHVGGEEAVKPCVAAHPNRIYALTGLILDNSRTYKLPHVRIEGSDFLHTSKEAAGSVEGEARYKTVSMSREGRGDGHLCGSSESVTVQLLHAQSRIGAAMQEISDVLSVWTRDDHAVTVAK